MNLRTTGNIRTTFVTILLLCPALIQIKTGLCRPHESEGGVVASDSLKPLYDFSPARIPMLSITSKESKAHVNALASEKLQGRGTGTAGQWLAAKYIAEEFSQYALEPAGDSGTFYEKFDVAELALQAAHLSLRNRADGAERVFRLRTDFMPLGITGENAVTGDIAFAGYGITAPEYGYDDYAQLDVHGKIVLVVRRQPNGKRESNFFDDSRDTRYAGDAYKAENALAHGAAGILLVDDRLGQQIENIRHGYWPSSLRQEARRKRLELQGAPASHDMPVAWISHETAAAILSLAGRNLAALQQKIDETQKPASLAIPGVTARTAIQLEKNIYKTQNVAGFLEGADPELRHELVVIGAHYDHVGIKDGRVFPGADDNASGTAGLLEIAEAFAEMPGRPARSLLFVAFSAEEIGLLGSRHHVEKNSDRLPRIAAMVNMDMIGRNDSDILTVIGTNRSPELHELNIAANQEIGFRLLYNGERYFNRSDQASFAEHGIPVIFYHTDSHADYHRPTDTPDKINAEKLTRIARLVFLVAWQIANQSERPTYEPLQPLGRH